MNRRTHQIGGICSGIMASCILLPGSFDNEKFILSSLIVAGAYVGSVIPDIDHPNSYIGRKFKFLSRGINRLMGHRGFIHSTLFWLLYSVVVLYSSFYFTGFMQVAYSMLALGSSIGFLSHLVLDGMTVSGIPIMYPFTRKQISFGRFRTNKHEWIVSMICVVITTITTAIII